MAQLITIYCNECNQEKEIVRNPQLVNPHDQFCYDCQKKLDEQKKKMHFAALKGLTLEERIEKIEKWIYDHNRKNHSSDMRY